MSSVGQPSVADEQTNRLMGALATVRNSVTLSIAVFGVFLFLLGFAINQGVWAAIFALWGTALTLFGLTAFTIIWWQRR
ncbi:hypothetical protein [Haloprofundus salilacus]|uniref:hypothetical protein n=1 Tax=Haloprofundus salilacus TaxID=2876190 RepID=UPI001CCF6465|nr:hypothetical protein [Haloprofundus salilacus]